MRAGERSLDSKTNFGSSYDGAESCRWEWLLIRGVPCSLTEGLACRSTINSGCRCSGNHCRSWFSPFNQPDRHEGTFRASWSPFCRCFGHSRRQRFGFFWLIISSLNLGVEGEPEIECGPTSITVNFNTRNPFEG
jgi:hypothetical protein